MDITVYLNDQMITPAGSDEEIDISNFKVSDVYKIEQNDIATIETIIQYYEGRYVFAKNILQSIRLAFYLKRFEDARMGIQSFKKILTEASQMLRKLATTEPEFINNPRKSQQAMQIMQQEIQTFDKLNLFFSGYEKKEQSYRKKKIRVVYEQLNEVLQEIQDALYGAKQEEIGEEEIIEKVTKSAIQEARDSDL
jgi:hypothetical protein